ncbi:polysaccharide pyruvyl transferase family protein [Marseilla massiliensis]|uniref:Polysaccharide pyruvyl transferase family protein n=1 Tax=Marseilla massiliensis TaxID=1841864 RepID=A0A939B4K1_9BACT|nr:polysaccharide pyruvyl transferase family protein [Marseilla massiliensis]MBM6672339.1 polysaccharide pyruvyl transferase family protein [Marseilla massiliensis]
MRKIGLVSVHNPNYGSLLQTYALQTYLNEIGVNNEIILYTKKNDLRQIRRLMNVQLVLMKWRVVYRDIYCRFFYPDIAKSFSLRMKAFENFKKKYFKFSPNHIGWKDLLTTNQDYDTFIIGSDQVWNPINIGTDFFNLLFTEDDKYRISYASSFGVSSIPNSQIKKTKQYLERIQCLSTREKTGVEIIKDLTGRDAELVCDPTLLVNKDLWDRLKGEKRFINEKYIFCYFLGNNPEHRDFANRFKAKTGYKLVALQHLDELILSDINFADIKPFDVGPAEFVNLISNAEFVLTDSFHGTIFSLLYHKRFFTFSRFESSSKGSTNSRVVSLLEMMNVKGHHIKATQAIDDCLKAEINFDLVDKKIEAFRQKSREYLHKALTNRDDNN